MVFGKLRSLSFILNESPFFSELSILERESVIRELLKQYPHLLQSDGDDIELGYEASWLASQKLHKFKN
jgi:hypothetical protein